MDSQVMFRPDSVKGLEPSWIPAPDRRIHSVHPHNSQDGSAAILVPPD